MNEINEPDNPNHCLEEPITQEEKLKKYTEGGEGVDVDGVGLAAWTTLPTLTRCC